MAHQETYPLFDYLEYHDERPGYVSVPSHVYLTPRRTSDFDKFASLESFQSSSRSGDCLLFRHQRATPCKARGFHLKDEMIEYEQGPPLDTFKLLHHMDKPKGNVRTMSTFSWLLLIVAILFAMFLFALDNTITADVIPIVIEEFGDSQKLPWLSVALQMGGTAVILPMGKLFGLFNMKWLYFIVVIIFLAGSALCGAAPNMNIFIVGRAFAGVGGLGIYLGTMTLLSVSTTEAERPVYLGLVGLVFGIGNVAGPLIGGAFAESSASWRWGFYLNLCIIGAMLPVYALLVPNHRPITGYSVLARIFKLDIVGVFLSVGFTVGIITGINFGGTLYAWDSMPIITLFAVTGALLMAFTIQQAFAILTTKADRLFPVEFLKQKEPVLLFILTAGLNAAAFVPIYYIPTYFQFTHGDSPLQSGIRLLPIIAFITTMVMVNGAALSRGGRYMPWFLIGSILALVGEVFMSLVAPTTTPAQIYGYQVLIGIGAGCAMQAGYPVIQSITKPEQLSHAIGFIMIAQLLGVTLSLSTAGSIFVNEAVLGLKKLFVGVSADEIQAALQGLSGQLLGTLSPEARQGALDVIVASLAKAYIPAYAAAAVGVVAAIFLRRDRAESSWSQVA